MTEKQPEQQTQKKKAGSINRYATLGRSGTSERQGVQTSEADNTETPERPSAQESERPEIPEKGTSKRSNVQEPERREVETSKRLDSQVSEHAGTEVPKRERHTIYLPSDLSKWIKHRAIDQKCEISELATEALERYRSEIE